jgi:hypothetical protein
MRLKLNWLAMLFLVGLVGCSAPELLVRQPALPDGAVVNDYEISLYQSPVHTFDRVDLQAIVKSEQRPPQVESLVVVLDSVGLKGKSFRGVSSEVYGREVLRRFHRSIPSNYPLQGGIFATRDDVTQFNPTKSTLTTYDPVVAESQLSKGFGPMALNGRTLADAIDNVTDATVTYPGRLAIVVLTSWDRVDELAVNAVMRMRQRHASANGLNVTGEIASAWKGRPQPGICVYAIGVGNAYSREKLSAAETCGAAWAADAIMQPAEMSNFVLSTFYGPPADDDGDGIPNFLDECSNTPAGRTVTSKGCLRFPSKDDQVGISQK